MDIAATVLAWFLMTVGATHFIVPHYYEGLIPDPLPAPRALVLASGAVEVGLGWLLLMSPTGWVGTVRSSV